MRLPAVKAPSVIASPSAIGGVLSFAYGLPPRTYLSEVVDFFSMPKEVEGVIPSNTESTLTFAQALRVYLKYKHNRLHLSGLWLP